MIDLFCKMRHPPLSMIGSKVIYRFLGGKYIVFDVYRRTILSQHISKFNSMKLVRGNHVRNTTMGGEFTKATGGRQNLCTFGLGLGIRN